MAHGTLSGRCIHCGGKTGIVQSNRTRVTKYRMQCGGCGREWNVLNMRRTSAVDAARVSLCALVDALDATDPAKAQGFPP